MDVSGLQCIELGAGAALPSIITALKNAKLVVATDYPADAMLRNLEYNMNKNLDTCKNWRVMGHLWGDHASIDALIRLSNFDAM